jgi:LacI family transcriptional regulator
MTLTLEDIARISGTSRSTVSRVINGDPNVSDRTREKVSRVIKELNFQPNLAARGLAAGRIGVIGLVIPVGVGKLFTDPFFQLLIQGVASECNARDHSVMLWLAEPDYERRMISKIMYTGLVDGVIVSSMLVDDPIVQALTESKLPYLLIGRHPTNPNASYIDITNNESARKATLYLIGLGRKRVATISGPSSMIVGQDRLSGYLAALAIQENGLHIPQDVAVIGFDDIPASSHTHPALTTVRQSIHQMGALAAETIIELIRRGQGAPLQVVMSTELIIRGTCGNTQIADT